jgi:RNA polymerase sigma factor (sigma-70 family)
MSTALTNPQVCSAVHQSDPVRILTSHPSITFVGPNPSQVTRSQAPVRKYKLPPGTDSDRPPHLDRWKNDQRYLRIKRAPTQHNGALVNHVHSRVSSRADAKGIAQETWGTSFRLSEPHVVSHVRAYLYATAKKIGDTFSRQRIVRGRYTEDQPLRALQEALSPDPIGLTTKESDALRRGVEALPAKAKLALLMVRQDGLSYEEVARELGVTTKTARRLVERAMEYLLEVVGEEKRSSS